MNQQINAMQESIKIALDAADAATDVTSEYKKIKNLMVISLDQLKIQLVPLTKIILSLH